MPYQQERSAEEFIAPVFIREGGYWENHMLPYLEAEGWAVIIYSIVLEWYRTWTSLSGSLKLSTHLQFS